MTQLILRVYESGLARMMARAAAASVALRVLAGVGGAAVLTGLAGCAGAPAGSEAARSVVLQWDPVTQRVNGEPLEPAQLSHYQVEQRNCGGAVDRVRELAGPVTRVEISAAELAGECIEFRVRAVTPDGQAGDWSEAVRWTRR